MRLAYLIVAVVSAAAQITESPDLEAARSLVVMIEGKLGEADVQGAGIVAAVTGDTVYVATAFHVVRRGDARASGVRVRFRGDPSKAYAAEHFAAASAEHDVAVLTVKAAGLRFPLHRMRGPKPLAQAEKVYAIGYPTVSGAKNPWGTTYQPGLIEDARQSATVSVQTAQIREGHSGGALIDERKCIAGMVLNTDGSSAGALRADRLVAILRTEIKVPAVQLSGDCDGREVHGSKYVWIAPASFTMGCSPGDEECEDAEKPAHQVRLTKGFWIGETEVTQEAYQRVTGKNPSSIEGAGLPVDTVTWAEADAFCKSTGGRLPAEAEWEYAARGGAAGVRYGDVDRIAWYGANSGGMAHAVKSKAPNRFGLYDMLGNLWEWTADWAAPYQGGPAVDPAGPAAGSEKVFRGASWFNLAVRTRVSERAAVEPGHSGNYNGFRCVRD